MLYLIYTQDVPQSLENRLSARPAHLARLQALRDAGLLVVAGPNPAIDSNDPGNAGFTGSTVIAAFTTLADAKPGPSKALCCSRSLCASDDQAV